MSVEASASDPPRTAAASAPGRPKRAGRSPREVIRRHSLPVRLTHWINALAIFLLLGTGANIFNAHPRLYWGRAGDDRDPALLSIHAEPAAHGAMRGVLQLGAVKLPTTGVLGWSKTDGRWMERAWPSWLTLPSYTDLADARHWHFMLAWILAVNGCLYLIWSVASGHLQRDLWPTVRDLRHIPQDVVDHLKNRHPRGEAAKRYNVLQKLAYLGLVLLVLGMVATGLTLSPGMNAAAPWLLDLFGGRQSARTLHFVFASLIVAFILVHISQVLLAGPLNETRSIVTGRFAVPPPEPD